jgi:hypothetical protein
MVWGGEKVYCIREIRIRKKSLFSERVIGLPRGRTGVRV